MPARGLLIALGAALKRALGGGEASLEAQLAPALAVVPVVQGQDRVSAAPVIATAGAPAAAPAETEAQSPSWLKSFVTVGAPKAAPANAALKVTLPAAKPAAPVTRSL